MSNPCGSLSSSGGLRGRGTRRCSGSCRIAGELWTLCLNFMSCLTNSSKCQANIWRKNTKCCLTSCHSNSNKNNNNNNLTNNYSNYTKATGALCVCRQTQLVVFAFTEQKLKQAKLKCRHMRACVMRQQPHAHIPCTMLSVQANSILCVCVCV